MDGPGRRTAPTPDEGARPPDVVVERRRSLPRPAALVWARATTPEGIRDELRPVLSMTMPPGLRGRSIADAGDVLDEPLGKAWLLLLGVVPVDFDDMTIVAVEPGRSFHERSRMLLLPHWEHERTILPLDDTSCEVVDRLSATPRLAGVAVVRRGVAVLVGALFSHRQRRLLRWCERT